MSTTNYVLKVFPTHTPRFSWEATASHQLFKNTTKYSVSFPCWLACGMKATRKESSVKKDILNYKHANTFCLKVILNAGYGRLIKHLTLDWNLYLTQKHHSYRKRLIPQRFVVCHWVQTPDPLSKTHLQELCVQRIVSIVMESEFLKSAESFVQFLRRGVSHFHVVKDCCERLSSSGFKRVSEKMAWSEEVKPMGKYFFTRNESAVVAIAVGGKYQQGNGFSIVAAHTDSPYLRLKPISKITSNGYCQLGVEAYGGGIWTSWLDRDLGIAGRVFVGLSFSFDWLVWSWWSHFL